MTRRVVKSQQATEAPTPLSLFLRIFWDAALAEVNARIDAEEAVALKSKAKLADAPTREARQ
jgi:hypothetical protein